MASTESREDGLTNPIPNEEEPLLGSTGSVTQKDTTPIYYNFLTGTAVVAQAGIWVLFAVIWSAIFSHDLIFFSAHPLLNSTALLLQVQGILVLQPTSTPRQKTLGAHIHFALLFLSLAAFISAFVVIEINKDPEHRLTSIHGILGFITYILIIIQALVGIAQFWIPRWVFGSIEKGKNVYRYHRIFGYVLLVLEFAAVAAATQTTYNISVLNIALWAVLVTSVITLLGVGARVKISKRCRNAELSRPPTAPKPVPDVKLIREHADLFARNCVDRNYAAYQDYPHRIKELYAETKTLEEALLNPRRKIKELEKEIGRVASSRVSSQELNGEGKQQALAALRQEAQRLKKGSQETLLRKESLENEIQKLALSLPNLTSREAPVGDDPRVVGYINYNPENSSTWLEQKQPYRSHVEIGTTLELLDFTSSATSTGWGWYFLTNEGALLEQALIQYSMDVALKRGWKAVAPPSIVYSYIQEACGYQPRDQNNEQQIWHIEQSEKDKAKPQRSLAGTAEIPLAAMYAGRDIDESLLPLKFVGTSRCYRAEAGARGVDTKGLYRVHEFTKVELFGWSNNPRSDESDPLFVNCVPLNDLFDELLQIQVEILTALNLPCRILEMPTNDLGASATRKRDIEALFPSRLRAIESSGSAENKGYDLETGWGEVTSASICTDYQSRRLGTRIRNNQDQKSRYPLTVNGTAVAVPRVLAAILENGWDEERQVVVIPESLRQWMGGMETIGRK
ncbi:seryl-tRNA synthetase [Talaromyces stipitatus ATCC 10500]|uniref:serine--tRNA ligase n=1 Tax=Talaromyces stipitatus (strain ATCC 10500 / CBS 375.48 / QM 6759 / NRRL 1006) TaxID=441959 RepID=B8M7Y3_TALSN|nr:seryl-tRNA synthetase [Talaromyces stipitatus ATCC 10500]EED19862.1 seryl-tRNA synthetase [Talaromyces stipitatus ATCC 10500]